MPSVPMLTCPHLSAGGDVPLGGTVFKIGSVWLPGWGVYLWVQTLLLAKLGSG